MPQTSHKRHLVNVNGIGETAEWISLHCRRYGHILLFHKYYHLNISVECCEDHKDVNIGNLCDSQQICYIFSNGQKNCFVSWISRGRLIKYPLSFIHIIYNMACVERFWSRWCSVWVQGGVGGQMCMCLYVHTQVMNVLRIANVYNNPSAIARIPHHYCCRGNANI